MAPGNQCLAGLLRVKPPRKVTLCSTGPGFFTLGCWFTRVAAGPQSMVMAANFHCFSGEELP